MLVLFLFIGSELVCIALFTGNRENLSNERSMSTSFHQIGESKFSLLACHARKPYSHKGFPRFQPEKLSGKTFIQVIKSSDQRPVKQGYGLTEKPQQEGMEGKGLGRKGKEGEGMNGLETHCLTSLNIPNNRHCIPGTFHPVLSTMSFGKNSIIICAKICRA